jgi:hypothetical protein
VPLLADSCYIVTCALRQRFVWPQVVQFVLDPRASRVGFAIAPGTLTLSIPMTGTTPEFQMPSVRGLVENALSLKPAIEVSLLASSLRTQRGRHQN